MEIHGTICVIKLKNQYKSMGLNSSLLYLWFSICYLIFQASSHPVIIVNNNYFLGNGSATGYSIDVQRLFDNQTNLCVYICSFCLF